MEGFGVIKFNNGNIYEGKFLQNRMHGQGKMIYIVKEVKKIN